MKSKYNSFCKKCRQRIRIGDEITKEGDAWVHDECPTGDALADAIRQSEKIGLETRNQLVDTTTFIGNSNFTPSFYQESIFDFVKNSQGNAVVEATAGSGKTTTIVKALEMVPAGKRVVFLAFNRHIVAELRKRAPAGVTVATIHSLGLSIIREMNPKVKIDEEKVFSILDEFWPVGREVDNHTRMMHRLLRSHMSKIVSLAKSTLVDVLNRQSVEEMIERYGLDLNGEQETILEKLPQVIQSCRNYDECVDFDDMPWLPVVEKMEFEKFDYVFVDEAQDLNFCNARFLCNIVSDTGRVIAVGDRNQSLYAFRGANPDAIPNLISALSATVLPLSISYRCPRSHVMEIKRFVSEIEPSDTAKDGSIEHIEYEQFLDIVQPGDMVLCRTNAPLVNPAFECIRRNKKAIIRGRDIGKSLVVFIQRFEASDLSQLDILMTEFTEHEYRRLVEKGKDLQAANAIEKLDTIREVAKRCKSIDDLTSKLLILFDDSNTGVVFSSIHRAKGLEADNVFILRKDLMPHPKAKQDWELVQERNAMFVAGTRSKDRLYYVTDRGV